MKMRDILNITEGQLVTTKPEAISGDLLGPARENMTLAQARDYLDSYPEGVLQHDIFETEAFVFITRSGQYGFYEPYARKKHQDELQTWDWDTDPADLAADEGVYDYDIYNGWYYSPCTDLFHQEGSDVWWNEVRSSSLPK